MDAKRPDGSAEVTTEAVSRAHALGLHGTLLVSGASVMIVEILGTRLLGPFFGLGTPVWAALITVTLAALALGYGLGGALADRRPSPALFHGLVVLAGVATALCRPLAGPVMERFEPLGLRAGALLSAVVIFGPSLFLLGTLTPFAVRLHPGRTSRTGGTVGRLYAVSTIGSVAGALLVGFVLVPAMPVSRIFQTTAGTLVLVGLLGLVLRRVKLGSAAAAGALALVVLAPGPEPEDPFGITVVRDEQTFYNRIQTIDAFHERFLFLDGLVHTHLSTTIPDDPVQCEYVRLVELLADVRPEAKRFLAIGCGGGGMLRLLEKPGRTFDVVDIDPAVIRAAREDFVADVKGATFHVGDGRRFLRREETWDACLLDVVSTEVMPVHLSTVEFLRELKARLAPDGVVLMNTVGEPGGRVLDSFGETMRAVFSNVVGYTAHETDETTNVVWLASDGSLELPELVDWAYRERVYACGDRGIELTDDFNPVNEWNADIGLKLRRELHERFGRAVFEVR